METVILLRMTGPRSIKAVQDWINVNADQDDTTAREVISSLPSLAIGEGWVWSPGFLRILERTTFPMFSTFDSHETPQPGQTRVVPKKRADIDLDRLGAEIAATRERAHDNDPRALRAEIHSLRDQLSATAQRADQAAQQASASAQLLAEREHEIAELRQQITNLQAQRRHNPQVVDALRSALDLITTSLHTLSAAPPPRSAPKPRNGESASKTAAVSDTPPPVAHPSSRRSAQTGPTTGNASIESNPNTPLRFRSGAQRMITALARMAPLRLTKAQWATVARIKHTGGTWSTYLGQLRRAGPHRRKRHRIHLDGRGLALHRPSA